MINGSKQKDLLWVMIVVMVLGDNLSLLFAIMIPLLVSLESHSFLLLFAIMIPLLVCLESYSFLLHHNYAQESHERPFMRYFEACCRSSFLLYTWRHWRASMIRAISFCFNLASMLYRHAWSPKQHDKYEMTFPWLLHFPTNPHHASLRFLSGFSCSSQL